MRTLLVFVVFAALGYAGAQLWLPKRDIEANTKCPAARNYITDCSLMQALYVCKSNAFEMQLCGSPEGVAPLLKGGESK